MDMTKRTEALLNEIVAVQAELTRFELCAKAARARLQELHNAFDESLREPLSVLNEEEKDMVRRGAYLTAVKHLRERSLVRNAEGGMTITLGLKEAKDIVDEYRNAHGL